MDCIIDNARKELVLLSVDCNIGSISSFFRKVGAHSTEAYLPTRLGPNLNYLVPLITLFFL